MFRRADAVWLVVDSTQPIDLEPIRRNAGTDISDVSATALPKGQAIRFRLTRPQLASLAGGVTNDNSGASSNTGKSWTLTFADTLKASSQPLMVRRNVNDVKRANITIPLARPGALHRITDPDAGDTLLVVTACHRRRVSSGDRISSSCRCWNRSRAWWCEPNSDDVTVDVASDRVTLTPAGWPDAIGGEYPARTRDVLCRSDFRRWRMAAKRSANFSRRRDKLIDAAAAAGDA